MGFAAQLTEILHALPSSRQTLLFSATLPKSLVEFARAGLQEPNLVRLDAESKVSPDLENAFFSLKSSDKEGALLHLLTDVIKVPTGATETSLAKSNDELKNGKKRKRGDGSSSKASESPTKHSTIVFAATKHHVEYLATLLRLSGFAVSYVYGSLDQTARKIQVQDFRSGMTNILVVTDVAARGIDIPILANVINYDFPSQPKIFVHRVGRTARAGQKGWSYSLVKDSDAPYLLDLQLFLGKKLIMGREAAENPNFAEDVVVGSLLRDQMERSSEWVTKLLDEDVDLSGLRLVAAKGEKLYLRTRNSASSESAKRSKNIVTSDAWTSLHPLFNDANDQIELEREKMLARVSGFRPQETVFEIGKRGQNNSDAADAMRKARSTFAVKKDKKKAIEGARQEEQFDLSVPTAQTSPDNDDKDSEISLQDADMDSASDNDLEVTFTGPNTNSATNISAPGSYQDTSHFMSYTPQTQNLSEDRAYGVHSGSYNTSTQSHFLSAARTATMDLANDETSKGSEPRGMRWDKRHKKYVQRQNDDDGSKGKKMMRGESGEKIAASFKSGRFDKWRKEHKIGRLPRTGEAENANKVGKMGGGGVGEKRYKHKREDAPKAADKYRDDYETRKKRVKEAREKGVGRFADGGKGAKGKGELRTNEDVRKGRNLKEKRKEKNARPKRKAR